jgi:hypothetical protein
MAEPGWEKPLNEERTAGKLQELELPTMNY